MQHYVLGLAISPDAKSILFIRKNRPAFQAGRLNGIGGKIEANETPAAAMRREFREETSLDTPEAAWAHFGVLEGLGFRVWCFTTRVVDIVQAQSATDELVERHEVLSDTWRESALSNLATLVHTALDPDAPFLTLTYREVADAQRAIFNASALPA